MTMPRLELISHDLCPYVQRSVITLTEKQIEHTRTYIDLSAKPAWFTRISPLGKVPLLRVGQATLFESAVICEYLDEVTPGSLHPRDPLEKATHRAWIEFASSILDDIAGFYNAADAAKLTEKQHRIATKLGRLEESFRGGPYFAGDDFSMVDAAYAPAFRYFDVFETIADFGLFTDTPRVSAWRHVLRARPSVCDAVPPGYPRRLLAFLRRRPSHLASLIPASLAA